MTRRRLIRLDRIRYVNMAPVFYRLNAEVEEVTGVPTRLERRLLAGRGRRGSDLVDRVRAQRGPAPPPAEALRVVRGSRRLLQALSRRSTRADPVDCGHDRVGDVGRPDEGARAGGDARPARRGGGREAPDRGRGAQVGVRGPDAAPRSRAALAGADGPADGVRRLGVSRAARRRARDTPRRRTHRQARPLLPEPPEIVVRRRVLEHRLEPSPIRSFASASSPTDVRPPPARAPSSGRPTSPTPA